MDMQSAYERAAVLYRLAEGKEQKGVLNALPDVQFCKGDGTPDFWYIKDIRMENGNTGKQFVRFSISKKAEEPLFCHQELLDLLVPAHLEKAEIDKLPVVINEVDDKAGCIYLTIEESGREFCYIPGKKELLPLHYKLFDPEEATSPDKNFSIFAKEFNLHMRDNRTGKVVQLTKDGKEGKGYGSGFAGVSQRLLGRRRPGFGRPPISWSPDSKTFLTYRNDSLALERLMLYQSRPVDGTERPILATYPYAVPGDEHIMNCKLFLGSVEEKALSPIMLEKEQIVLLMSMIFSGNDDKLRWSEDGKMVYMLFFDRFFKETSLLVIDIEAKEAKKLISDSYNTFSQMDYFGGRERYGGISSFILDSGEIIWHSERDGWAALSLYDKDAKLKRRLTGDWVVRRVYHVDQKKREIYFAAGGKEEELDPYIQQIYKLHMDTAEITGLTEDKFEHQVRFAPCGCYFVDTYSDIATKPITLLRDTSGEIMATVVESDIQAIVDAGFIFPEPIEALARDGKTPIYGLLIKPYDFDPTKKYPIVNFVYGGAQRINTSKSFSFREMQLVDPNCGLQSMAQLGFIGIIIDGLATPLRSKKIHDMAYEKHEESCGLEDQVGAIEQLAKKYSWIDIDRVGLYGASGGGYATARGMLQFPDFFKVGFSMCGNHDQTIYNAQWGERWCGVYSKEAYKAQSNATYAENLKGKLYILHGELDDNVHPAHSIRLAAALIEANKSFDFLLVPNADHGLGQSAYLSRLRWDYFVRHLKGEEPPQNFEILPKKKEEEKEEVKEEKKD